MAKRRLFSVSINTLSNSKDEGPLLLSSSAAGVGVDPVSSFALGFRNSCHRSTSGMLPPSSDGRKRDISIGMGMIRDVGWSMHCFFVSLYHSNSHMCVW